MAKYDLSIPEDEIKNLVRSDWFDKYDGNRSIGNIDFSVCMPTDPNQLEIFDLDFFLWAEAKKGNNEDIDDSFVQLIMTIMKARTYNDYMPPLYLAAFDAEKIAFIPYDEKLQRQVIFDSILENDIDWTRVTPSDHNSIEFAKVKKKAKDILLGKLQFDFIKEAKQLKQFIKSNFIAAKTGTNKINITLNRMTSIFNRWLEVVKPTIDVPWAKLANEYNILPADFFLADVISKNNQSLGASLQVLLRSNIYQVTQQTMFLGKPHKSLIGEVKFKDNQNAHKTFWNKYNRPPRRKERLQMQERRDLLVEPDRRERKGAYYTPPKWTDLSQEYIMKVLGENWQNEYYVWDCCAGTGNLLNGLVEKERIFASTLDEAEVNYMKTKKNLLPLHVFQFDFLNDDLFGEKVPEDLKRILKDPEERRKLVIYINPPFKEAANAKTISGNGENKTNVAVTTKIYKQYQSKIGIAGRELFAQFFTRIYCEIPSCILAQFSTLKLLQAPNFVEFRHLFKAELKSSFIVMSNTFENVPSKFPIGFFIWDTSVKSNFVSTISDVYDSKGNFMQTKLISLLDNERTINEWIITTRNRPNEKPIGYMSAKGNDFQNTNYIYIVNNKIQLPHPRGTIVTTANISEIAVYLSVRHCIKATWLNNRDQFLFPRKAWKEDKEFQSDCLVYTIFHGQNKISSKEGTNHWIPFTEKEVNAPMLFESHFMSDFIAGKVKSEVLENLFGTEKNLTPTEPIQFSREAQAVMDAGREIWRCYMSKKDDLDFDTNASFYDIRRYFQGEKNGKMNSDSEDKTYMRLWGNIKDALKVLAAKITPKVYLYGFLLDETTLPEDEKDIVTPQKPLPVKPAKRAPKPKAKSSSVTIVKHYHIDTYNDNSTNYNIEK